MNPLTAYRTIVACCVLIIGLTLAGAITSVLLGEWQTLPWQFIAVSGHVLALLHMRRPTSSKETDRA